MDSSTARRAHAFCLALVCGAALCAAATREASARQQDEKRVPRTLAEKIDEYGKLGHCDLTARLDNLAIELQNDPEVLGYLVGFDPSERPGPYAESYVKRSAAYLVMSRGLDESRIRMRYGGRNDTDEVKTQLWIVPRDGYLPIITTALMEDDDGTELSGRIEHYATEDVPSVVGDEMGGPSMEEIGQLHFARALKKQPASQGYIVVYTAASELPGAWRRIARREEASLRERFELAEGRVRLLNGGTAGETKVELWIQPKDAPPPVKEAGEEKSPKAAFMLYDLGNKHYLARDAGEDGRLLADFADLLGADKRVRLNFIIHPAAPKEEEEEAEEADASNGAESGQTAGAPPTGEQPRAATAEAAAQEAQPVAGKPGADDANAAAPEDTLEEESYERKAQRWRESMAKKYGTAPERVVITVGRQNSWSSETLEVWVVPADAPLPDPFAPEPEEEAEPNEEDGAAQEAPPAL